MNAWIASKFHLEIMSLMPVESVAATHLAVQIVKELHMALQPLISAANAMATMHVSTVQDSHTGMHS